MKKYVYGVGVIISLSIVVLCGQSLVQSPKIKKVYVSCQQYLELAGDVITSANSLWGLCCDVSKQVCLIQQESLGTINSHVDGDKNCFLQHADKVERTEKYTKLMKIKDALDLIIEELHVLKQRLDVLIADFNASPKTVSS